MAEEREVQQLAQAIARQVVATVAAMLARNPALARQQVAAEQDRSQSLLHRTIPPDGHPLGDAHVAIVRLLLNAGAEVDAPGWGANNRALVEVLLTHAADVDRHAAEADHYWPTPLHVAARWGSLGEVERLLDAGADPNGGSAARGAFGTSALTWAVAAGKENLLRLLLARGMDLAHENHREALHLAAESGRAGIARLLLKNGVDPQRPDFAGQTPAERARRFGQPEVAELVASWGGA
jgi:hypothetical protein